MKYLLMHPPTFAVVPYAAPFAAEQVETRRITMPGELTVGETPTTLVLDPASRDRFPAADLRGFVDRGGACVVLGAAEERDLPERFPPELVSAFLPAGPGERQFLVALRSCFREAAARSDAVRARADVASRTNELTELIRIGMALSTERDLNTLLETILSQARALTDADGGSLYLVEQPDDPLQASTIGAVVHCTSRTAPKRSTTSPGTPSPSLVPPTPESSWRLLQVLCRFCCFRHAWQAWLSLAPLSGLTCRCCKFHFMLRAAALLPFLGELQRFDTISHPTASVACFPAS